MPLNSQDKGKRAEREFAAILRKRFGLDDYNKLKRTPGSGGLGIKGDILTTQPPFNRFHFEIKHQETASIWKWLAQTEADARQGKLRVLAFRRNRSDWYVAMPAADWMDILYELIEAEKAAYIAKYRLAAADRAVDELEKKYNELEGKIANLEALGKAMKDGNKYDAR